MSISNNSNIGQISSKVLENVRNADKNVKMMTKNLVGKLSNSTKEIASKVGEKLVLNLNKFCGQIPKELGNISIVGAAKGLMDGLKEIRSKMLSKEESMVSYASRPRNEEVRNAESNVVYYKDELEALQYIHGKNSPRSEIAEAKANLAKAEAELKKAEDKLAENLLSNSMANPNVSLES